MYFDAASTMKPIPEALEEYMRIQTDVWGNPSAVHAKGQKAKAELEQARQSVASTLGCPSESIYFATNATQADNHIILGSMLGQPNSDVLISNTGHPALYETKDSSLVARLGNVVQAQVDSLRPIAWQNIQEHITDRTSLVSLMHVHNEHGGIVDLEHVYKEIRVLNEKKNVQTLLHVDGVQAGLYQDLKESILYSDFYVLSGHKIGAPRGCSIVYAKDISRLSPIYSGGGQERSIFPGTENLAAIVATARALNIQQSRMLEYRQHIANLFQSISDTASTLGLEIVNYSDIFQHTHILFKIPNSNAQEVLMYLDMKGYALSAGSSCQSGASTVSHVIRNSRLDTSASYIRMSLSPNSQEKACIECVNALHDYTLM